MVGWPLIWEHTCTAPTRDDAVKNLLRTRPDMRIVAVYRMETPTRLLPTTGQLDVASWLIGLVCRRYRTWRVIAREDG